MADSSSSPGSQTSTGGSSEDAPDDASSGNRRVTRSASSSSLKKACECPAEGEGPTTVTTVLRLPPGTDLSLRHGNPHYGRRMQLYCRTGFHLTIVDETTVKGLDEDMNEFAVVEFTSAGHGGLVRIRGVKSNLYLAMNIKGKLYGEPNPEKEETVFQEGVLSQYNTYMSHKFKKLKWYVGIKKSGKQKAGPQTKWGQKATQFLPRRTSE